MESVAGDDASFTRLKTPPGTVGEAEHTRLPSASHALSPLQAAPLLAQSPLGPHFCGCWPLQRSSFGSHGLHTPATQNGLPPEHALFVLAEPSALQVFTALPSQVTALGVQTCALQVALALSQYWLVVHSVVTVPEPSELHVFTALPSHEAVPGEQTWALQPGDAASQYWDAVQVAVMVDDKPSVAHVITFFAEHTLPLGVQTCALHSPLLHVVLAPQLSPPAV